MNRLRFHFVAASAAASVGVAASAIYMLLAGESGVLRFAAFAIPIFGVSYPAMLAGMKSSHDRCSEWLRQLAAARR